MTLKTAWDKVKPEYVAATAGFVVGFLLLFLFIISFAEPQFYGEAFLLGLGNGILWFAFFFVKWKLKYSKPPSNFWKTMAKEIFVTLIVVYFVVSWLPSLLNPVKYLPLKCSFPMGIYCTDWKIRRASISIGLTAEKPLIITELYMTENSYSPLHKCNFDSAIGGGLILKPGQTTSIESDVCIPQDLYGGYKYKYEITVKYHFPDDISETTLYGELYGPAEIETPSDYLAFHSREVSDQPLFLEAMALIFLLSLDFLKYRLLRRKS